jgi:hypothetical protein
VAHLEYCSSTISVKQIRSFTVNHTSKERKATMFETVFYAALALPWVALVAMAIADEIMFRRRFRK